VYRLCCKILGTWGAIVASGILFGLVHGIDPGATATALSSVALAGLLLGAAFALSRRLWLPIGIHTGWNFAEGSLFGTAVSGNSLGGSLATATLSGPEILTGGRFGPEASIVTVIVLFVATAFLLWRTARRRRSEPPIWRAGKGEHAGSRA
jgi:membrane protease YdiL (CAAX protease family)